jgi:hypothetical protein
MSEIREKGRQIGEGIALLRFLPATNNYKALNRFPAFLFQEYKPDPERNYERGEVIRMPDDSVSKYLLTGDGRIQSTPRIENNQVQPSLLKLFRNAARANWVREEFCERGFERYWENPQRPEENGWYRVIVDVVDDADTPPNAPQRWERLPE